MTLRHCRHRQDGRGTNFPPRWRDPPTTDRREIMNHDAEFRREDAAGGIGVSCAALDLCRGERAKHVPRSRSDVARQPRPGGTMAGPPRLRRN